MDNLKWWQLNVICRFVDKVDDAIEDARLPGYKYRENREPLMPEDSINLREAVQKKAVLKDILFGGLKETDIPNAVETAFSDLPYANDRQREQKEMDAVNQLMRYAHSEKRITEL